MDKNLRMNRKFSVVMSTYSKESSKNLYLCLKSIFRNTLKPNEFVLVKDGPLTLELDNIIKNFQHIHKNLKVYELEHNQGSAIAMNFAISKSVNNWIIKHDTDDFSYKNRFKRLMSLTTNDPCFFGSYMIERKGRIRKLKKVPLSNEFIKRSIIYRNPFNNPTMCFHRNVFLNSVGYQNIRYKEDWAFWIKNVNKFNNFNIEDILVTSINSSQLLERRRGLFNIYSEFCIQKLCIKENLSNFWKSTLIYILRVGLLLMPTNILHKIYDYFLRTNK